MAQTGISYIFVVAQRPGGPNSNLATVAPLCSLDGTPLDSSDFPAYGLAFWHVSDQEAGLAEPGNLVIASLVPATSRDADHEFRLKSETVRAPDASTLIEVIPSFQDLPISHPRDVILRGAIAFERPTAPFVVVEGHTAVFGLYKSTSVPTYSDASGYDVSFAAAEPDISQYDISQFNEFRNRSSTKIFQAEVSLSANERTKGWVKRAQFSYELIVGQSLRELRQLPHTRISARTPSEILRPVIDRFRNVQKLDDFEKNFIVMLDLIADGRLPKLPGQGETIEQVQALLKRDKRTLNDLANAVVDSGFLNESIESAKTNKVSEFLEKQSAQLMQSIRETHAKEQERLTEARAQVYRIEQDYAELRRKQEESFKEREREFSIGLAQREKQLRQQESGLESRKQEIEKLLSDASQYFSRNREDLLQTYLALEPLLSRIGLTSVSGSKPSEVSSAGHTAKCVEFPAFVLGVPMTHVPMLEIDFFERFKSRVLAENFRYREEDLLAYHHNFKTSDFIILGGASGIGKSSLPKFYSDALHGTSERETRFIAIPVSPTWMDFHDLLGHVNIVDRCFVPSETQLYRYMLYATQEYNSNAHSSGLYSIVLDEMNLSHVEHYFAPFLRHLGSKSGAELLSDDVNNIPSIQVFDSDAVSPDHIFRNYSAVRKPPTVRFIGTVNYDETTKQLSARVLDRGPLIQLHSLGTLSHTRPQGTPWTGPPVTLRHFGEWLVPRQLESSEDKLISDLRPLLLALGCPLTARRERAIVTFICTASPELFPDNARVMDMALSQRLFPLIGRQLFRSAAREALRSVAKILDESGLELKDSKAMVSGMADADFDGMQSV
jgi:hypothetical protein